MGPVGGERLASRLLSRETRLGGDAAAERFSSGRTPGGDSRLAAGMARRGWVSPRGSPPRAGEGQPSSLADVPASGSRGASWSVAGALGWVVVRGRGGW